jgi:hypothetical protein
MMASSETTVLTATVGRNDYIGQVLGRIRQLGFNKPQSRSMYPVSCTPEHARLQNYAVCMPIKMI